ncbi:MAG: hypothetical protein WKF95_08350 [Rubrobacter sp.]
MLDVTANFIEYESQGAYFDTAFSAAWLLIIGIVLGSISFAFIRLEGTPRPGLVDHVRHCCLLYLSLVILSVAVVSDYVASRTATTYRQEVATPTVDWLLFVIYPVLIDALILLHQRRRFDLASSESLA